MPTEDVVLTFDEQQDSKREMRSRIERILQKIDNMKVLKQELGKELASISTCMDVNGKKQHETYKLRKVAEKRLIYMEINH